MTFDASAGTAYRIAVGGQSNGDQGSFTLTGAAVVPPVVNPPVQNPPAAKKCKKGFKKIKGKCKKKKKRKRKK